MSTPTNVNDIRVNMAVNREIITPLRLGTIQYTRPTTFTTAQVSEILVLDAPVPYQRFAATSPFNSIINSKQYPTISSKGFESLPPLPPMPSVSGGFEAIILNSYYRLLLERWQLSQDLRYKLAEEMGRLGVWSDAALNAVASGWSSLKSSAFYPQIDFFNRYNEWFSSVTWMTPESSSSPAAAVGASSSRSAPVIGPPQNVGSNFITLNNFVWPVLFVYVDRPNKQLYSVPGVVQASRIDDVSLPDESDSISIAEARAGITKSPNGQILGAEFNITWSSVGLESGIAFLRIIANDSVIGTVSPRVNSFSRTYDSTSPSGSVVPSWANILGSAEDGVLVFKIIASASTGDRQIVSNTFSIVSEITIL